MDEITASEYVKRHGFSSLKELSGMTGFSVHHLRGWYYQKRPFFRMVVMGALIVKHKELVK